MPPISTIIGEPDLLPALDVIAKARHVAARRLADGAVLEARRRLGHLVVAGPIAGSRRMEMPLLAPAVDPALSVEPASGQGLAPVGAARAQVEGALPQPVGSSNDLVAIDRAAGARLMPEVEPLRLFATGRRRNRSRFDTEIVPKGGEVAAGGEGAGGVRAEDPGEVGEQRLEGGDGLLDPAYCSEVLPCLQLRHLLALPPGVAPGQGQRGAEPVGEDVEEAPPGAAPLEAHRVRSGSEVSVMTTMAARSDNEPNQSGRPSRLIGLPWWQMSAVRTAC